MAPSGPPGVPTSLAATGRGPELRGLAARSPHSVRRRARARGQVRGDRMELSALAPEGFSHPGIDRIPTHPFLMGAGSYARTTRKRRQRLNAGTDPHLEAHTEWARKPHTHCRHPPHTHTPTHTHTHLTHPLTHTHTPLPPDSHRCGHEPHPHTPTHTHTHTHTNIHTM